MCKITDFQFDEAMEVVRCRLPHTAQTIETYIDQLERETRNMRERLEMFEEHHARQREFFGIEEK
jgi:hypothetical protein